MIISRLNLEDNLDEVCLQFAPEKWGKDNDMSVYTSSALRTFLSSNHNVLVVGRVDNTIVCSALCYVLDHPDPTRKSLYIDELDTHPDHRRKGYASELITWLRNFAAELNLSEVWLGTETNDNEGANAFYRSLNPDEIILCNLYSYLSSDQQ